MGLRNDSRNIRSDMGCFFLSGDERQPARSAERNASRNGRPGKIWQKPIAENHCCFTIELMPEPCCIAPAD
ncbi:MAG TPA: hypothetical protein VGU61_15925 [Noviherbaspirillum sp.]|jgi:hypothetical protein|nr:hypothetical protein [Noviherbaspirillum sp.]